MSLSISNSNQQGKSPMTSQKLYGKTIFAIGLCIALALLSIHLILQGMGANSQGALGRVTESRAALPKIVKEPNEVVMFFGSSMTRAGFSPRKFDADLAEQGKQVKSFNFGFGGLNPYFQDFLSRRIADEFVKEDRKIKLAMIEFNPFQTTQTRWNNASPVLDSFLTLLANDEELMEIAKTDLTRGIRLFNIKYLRGSISAEMITSFFARELFPPQAHQTFKDDDEIIAERGRLGRLLGEKFDEEYPNYKGEAWSYTWQGGGTIPQERSEETLAIFDDYYRVTQTDNMMKNDRLSRIRSADIEELNFEPLLVEHFINIIKNFQRVSENVEVMMLPKNSKWIKTTPAAEKRLAAVVKQIEEATGIKMKDHQNLPQITSAMYRDTTHLSRYRGDIAYTNYLIQQYQNIL
ncbi:MAG: hypothetical protein ACPG5Z_05915 [Pseudoalteromonas sp.]|uniref:hypothetical protein n=1 Tax=unclassified Pseudoalteromonas TaxID=194690 RepID=UPI000C070BDC|nr:MULTISPECIES: hypothetical protein [unclassified Pseudoalteromonas]MDP2633795.1 hypothetical protein [Pseudoalteromonas sp. 1_MG-2023]PHN88956.1 hypothetical protein CSC79_14945 [Pseudoalteromonas sp. 3D05]